jgi:hypothetical protein
MWKIRAFLDEGKYIDLGDVRSGKPGWSDFNPSGISRIEFPFVGKMSGGIITKSRLIISNMVSYNFFVEASKNILSGSTTIKNMWFLGKTPEGKVVGFTIGEKVKPINTLFGLEYNGFASVGWKQGISKGTPTATIVRE